MSDKFAFTPIEGKLSLEEATEQLVHLAKCIQRTHDNASADEPRLALEHMFDSRKTGMLALLDLIQQYIEQKPDQLGRKKNELEIPTS